LFLAQDYTPTKLEVRVREENIKGWQSHELTRLGEASPKNNSILEYFDRWQNPSIDNKSREQEGQKKNSLEQGISSLAPAGVESKEKDSLYPKASLVSPQSESVVVDSKDVGQVVEKEIKEPKRNLVERFKEIVNKHQSINFLKSIGVKKEDAESLVTTMNEVGPEVHDLRLISQFCTATKAYVEENIGKGKDLPKDEKKVQVVVMKAIDRLKMLGFGSHNLNILPFITEESKREISITSSFAQTIYPENVLDIGRASDEKWNQLINTLKEIPHVNELTISIQGLKPILENGLSEKQQKYLERLKDNVILKKNSREMEGLIMALFREDEVIDYHTNQQNFRAVALFKGQEDRWGDLTEPPSLDSYDVNLNRKIAFQIASLKYCPLLLDGEYEIPDSVLSDLSWSDFMTTEVVDRTTIRGRKYVFPEDFKERFKLIGDLMRYRNEDFDNNNRDAWEKRLKAYQFATDFTDNRDVVPWLNLYMSLGIREPGIRKRVLEDPNNAMTYIERLLIEHTVVISGMGITDRESLRSFLSQSQENRDLVKISELMFPFIGYRDHFNLKREDALEMYRVENGELILKEKFFEYIFSRDTFLEGDPGYSYEIYREILNKENISKLSNPDAKQFWELAANYLNTKVFFDLFMTEIKENSFDYRAFFKKWNVEQGSENFLLEKTVSTLLNNDVEGYEKGRLISIFSDILDEKLKQGEKEGYKLIFEKFVSISNENQEYVCSIISMLGAKLSTESLQEDRDLFLWSLENFPSSRSSNLESVTEREIQIMRELSSALLTPLGDNDPKIINMVLQKIAFIDPREFDDAMTLDNLMDSFSKDSHLYNQENSQFMFNIIKHHIETNTYFSSKVMDGIVEVFSRELGNSELPKRLLDTFIVSFNQSENLTQQESIYFTLNKMLQQLKGYPLQKEILDQYPLLNELTIVEKARRAIFIPKEKLQQLVENGITVERYIGEIKLNTFVPSEIIQDISYWKDGELNKGKIYDFFVSNGVPEQMADNFEKGGEIFGKEKMVKYIQGHPDVTLHDRLYQMDSIEKLYLASKLSPEAFFGNILNGVVLDDSIYAEGSSYNHLNALMGSIDMNIFTQEGMNKLGMQLKKYQETIGDIEYAKNLVTDIRILFSSWKNLDKGVAVLDQLKSGELLDIIVDLQDSGQSKIANWVKTLGFHRESKVSLSALLKFAKRPDEFLSAGDLHAPNQFHSKKRPSEYLERGLLSGTELIKSLIEGDYDKIQTFKPFEKRFRIPNNPERKVEEIIREAIGSRRDSIRGKSLNPGRLFAEMSNKFKEKGKNLEEFLKGNLSFEEYWGDEYWSVGEEIKEDILFNTEYGLPKEFITKNFIEIIAQVHQKSDPMAVIAGDDTACCMAFGTGKNNVYMFNPSIGMFTVRIVRGNGDSRTIAQSVLTLDQDVGTDASKLEDVFVRDPKSIKPDIKEKILRNDEFYLVCDNIEVAPNYSKLVPKIKEVYKGFFSAYLSEKNNVSKPVNKEKIVIGTGYSDISGWDTMPNHFVPVAPPSYSDNVHSESFYSQLNTKSDTKGNSSEVVTTGVTELGVEDSLQVAVIESEAYSDNKSLQEGLVRMMNRIIAVQVFNARNNRPNMCLKYVGDDNSTKAYMVAYERANTKEDRHLYIEDFASRKGEGLGAGRILRSLIEKYKENYIDKGDIIPIVMEARDQTSYQLLKRQIDRISEMLGIKLVEDEIEQNLVGTDTMHSIILRPQMTQEKVSVSV